MSVDFETEPEIPWSKIAHAIKSGQISGLELVDHKKTEPWNKDTISHLIQKGKNYLYAFELLNGVLYREYGSKWASKNPIMDAISKHFKVKYYADIDSDEWDEHVQRTSHVKKKATHKTVKKPKVGMVDIIKGNGLL